ncbi:MAG: NAD(P)H-quinone oxidoreductase [Bradymonadaceae bacterium]|nr:NAD(P)H-quinone oxidoreductase [Lujinxingiaceae bacterium]
MKAISILDDDARTLCWQETRTPTPGQGEVLVRVRASAVNRADLLQRIGHYPIPAGASEILGLEAAGEIAQLGPGVSGWRVGDRVCCLLAGGGYAENVVTPASLLLALPDSMSYTDAAAIPEVFYTAFLNIFLEAEQKPGEWVLVHAGASGVGTAAIQLCRAFQSPVIATASASKLGHLRDMGVVEAIDREHDDFGARVARLTEKRGVDIILDPVGGAYFERNLHCLATGGRLVNIGLLGGTDAPLSLGRLLMKRLRVIGSLLRSRSLQEKEAITVEFRQRVWPMFEAGALKPVIHQVLPIDQAQQAHAMLQANATIGKVVLHIP